MAANIIPSDPMNPGCMAVPRGSIIGGTLMDTCVDCGHEIAGEGTAVDGEWYCYGCEDGACESNGHPEPDR